MAKNNLRKAALLGVKVRPPAFHPFRPLLPLRVSSLDLEDDAREALVGALFRATWTDQLHVSEPEVVAQVADSVGLDGARLVVKPRGQRDRALPRATPADLIRQLNPVSR